MVLPDEQRHQPGNRPAQPIPRQLPIQASGFFFARTWTDVVDDAGTMSCWLEGDWVNTGSS
jgi:hypothetical protein